VADPAGLAGPADVWTDRAFLRDVQYRTDANLAARQSIYAYQHPPIDLPARVLDLAVPAGAGTIVDVGCGNGAYLAELARRGFGGRVVGADLPRSWNPCGQISGQVSMRGSRPARHHSYKWIAMCLSSNR
jgi:SAM-dependent methyltransferase